MPDDGRPIDDDVRALIEQIRAQSTQTSREPVERGADRRVADRRGLGFTARRRDNAEWNRHVRVFLFEFFRALPHDTLLTWVDGM